MPVDELHHVWSQDGKLNKAAEREVSSSWGNLEGLAPQRHLAVADGGLV